MELRKINIQDALAQWEYTTALPADENGLTDPYLDLFNLCGTGIHGRCSIAKCPIMKLNKELLVLYWNQYYCRSVKADKSMSCFMACL